MEACVHVVDDDAAVRSAIAFLLSSNGIRSRSFASGFELLDRLDDLPRCCILLDLCLPRISGSQVLKELARRGARRPVIAMTGRANAEMQEDAVALGALTVLEKPFAERELLSALDLAFEELEVQRAEP
jgi:FixJ family two-component response regulator